MRPPLILASSSRYRAALLERLRLPFTTDSPDIDESPRADEPARARVLRLARAKAAAVATRHPGACVLGSDQLALRDAEVLGKPLNAARCEAQLMAASGREVTFLTAACLLTTGSRGQLEHIDTTRVRFRTLSAAEVRRYVELESPLDCAGGFKCEGLGIALFEHIESKDPTALVGLPLIWVAQALRQAGLDPLEERMADGG